MGNCLAIWQEWSGADDWETVKEMQCVILKAATILASESISLCSWMSHEYSHQRNIAFLKHWEIQNLEILCKREKLYSNYFIRMYFPNEVWSRMFSSTLFYLK